MDEPESHTPSLLVDLTLGTTLLVVASSVGTSSALLADRTLPSLLVLWLEPVLWFGFLALAGLLVVARRRHWVLVGASVLGLALLCGLLRFPSMASSPPSPSSEIPRAIRHTMRDLERPRSSVRLATWNAAGLAPDKAPLAGLDVAVLLDASSPSREPEGGRILFAPTDTDRGLALVVPSGGFTSLGDHGTWLRFELATGEAVFAIARTPKGDLPILAVDLETPQDLGEAGAWAGQLQETARELASLAATLSSPSLVLAGDTGTHSTFRYFLQRIASADLRTAPSRATWPATVGGLPVPPLYHLDRAWYGTAWALKDHSTERWGSDHLALVLELEPTEG